jgi:hypothetical protein
VKQIVSFQLLQPTYYVFLGGPETRWFDAHERDERFAAYKWYWTCLKNAKVGDQAFIYLTAPISRIVGKIEIVAEPFFHLDQTIFDNPKMANKYCAEVKYIESYELREDLTMKGLRRLFPDWPWLTMPRSNTRIPKEFLSAFLELIQRPTE